MREKSLDFLGYPNYTITDDGRVFSLNYHKEGYKKELKQRNDIKGYKRVYISSHSKDKSFLVHRLVALAFIPNTDNLPQVNHKDENKSNNIVENLEWCSNYYNAHYRDKVERTAKAHWKPIKQFTKDGLFIREWDSIKEACETLHMSSGYIVDTLKGRHKQAHGYIWRYA